MQTIHLITFAVLAVSVLSGCERPETDAGAISPEATSTSPQPPAYSADAFYRTTSYRLAAPEGFAFSSDGSALLVSSDQTGVFNLYRLPIDGGEAQALTSSTDNAIFARSWFPADDRVLYTFDGGGDELNHVAVRESDGSVLDLTPGDDLKADFVGWSDNGSHFYLMTTERNQQAFDLYRYSAEDYSREMIFENPGFGIAAISSDGRWLALEKPRTSADSNLYVVDLEADSTEPTLITAHEGNIQHTLLTILADNRTLIYGTDEHGEFQTAWRYDLETGERAEFIAQDWDIGYVADSWSGKYLTYAVNADARTVVSMTNQATGDPVKLPDLPQGQLMSVRFSADESHLALMVNADNSPPNVFVVDLSENEAQQLTQALNPDIDPAHLVTSEIIRYPSFDGLEIPAILYKPKGAGPENKVPALVLVHGGPGGQTRTGYRAMVQHLVNHGYAILGANNRGSSGYGKTFYHLDDRRHGEGDLQDIVYGKKYLESLDWVDTESIGIMGGSYGGFMVAAALAFEPDVFDVGINIFGVTNWVRTLENIPPWWLAFKESLYDEMGDPATDGDRHRRISPLFHASAINRPLLVVQGANDPRVLQVESDELVAAVRANDVPVEYVVFPDEGHGFTKRVNRIAASEAYVRFLNTHLRR